nr:ABC transporter permease [Polycladospora coralii]
MALDSIWAHKLRSILTMLGIVIGVSSVIIIVGIGQGGKEQLTESVTGSGNSITIVPKFDENEMYIPDESVQYFTPADLEGLKRIPEIKEVVYSSMQSGSIQNKDKTVEGAMVFGVNSNRAFDTYGAIVDKGTLFTDADYQSGGNGIIISQNVAEDLFEDEEPVGKILRVHAQPLQVIGVLQKPTGLQGMFDFPNAYIPAPTWQNIFGSLDVSQIDVQVESAEQIQVAGESAISLLNDNHSGQQEYEVQNFESFTEMISKVTDIMTLVIGSIGSISLLVGGIGVMNIMLVSVTERTREIGIRKSLGATRRNILMQFLIESVTLTSIGGAMGILLGAFVIYTIRLLGIFPASVSIWVAIGGVLFSMLFGVVFGILPANKASKLHPIDCLRYD